MLFSSASAAFAATKSNSGSTSTLNDSAAGNHGSKTKTGKPNGRSSKLASVFRSKKTTEGRTSNLPLNLDSTSKTRYSKPHGQSTNVEEQHDACSQKWTPFPSSTPTALVDKLNEMYWSAVHCEVKQIILTLIDWDRSGLALEEETIAMLTNSEFLDADYDIDGLYQEDDIYDAARGIYGFDTFLEQVSGEFREFADRYRKLRVKGGDNTDLEKILAERIQTEIYYANSLKLKDEVKSILNSIERKKETQDMRRARLLLQSLGLLDIDKLLEYQEYESYSSQRPSEATNAPQEGCTRGLTPQLRFLGVDEKTGDLKLGVDECAEQACGSILRGNMFSQTKELDKATEFICEGCFWLAKAKGNADKYVLFNKHSILDKRVITKDVSQKLCKCGRVCRTDEAGAQIALFPVNSELLHDGNDSERRAFGDTGELRSVCALLRLKHMVAQVKLSDFLGEVDGRKALAKVEKAAEEKMFESFRRIQRRKTSEDSHSRRSGPSVGIFTKGTPNLYYVGNEDKLGMKGAWKKAWKADEEAYGNFDNMHMSVMIGPLIIENRTPNAMEGVVISVRRPGQLRMQYDGSFIEDCVSISEQRQCSVNKRSPRQRRLRACMKQIVGGTFVKGGYIHPVLEEAIVQQLVVEYKKNQRPTESQLEESAYKIVEMLKNMLENHVRVHLNLISQKLFNPAIRLRWSPRVNNCERFCDNLLDWAEYRPLACNSTHPMYLFSFLTRPGSWGRVDIKTKFDVPNGLTEEYLLQWRSNTSKSDADIIDTLNEYWHDWSSLGGYIYKNQSLFPWDCTEAYGKHPTKCNNCNLAKHVWSHPFDSWSIIQLHFSKERQLYPRTTNNLQIDNEWIENRLKLLLAQDALSSGALAMARSPKFRADCQWLALTTQANTKLNRVKLGGIHRAQPFSHDFEKEKYHEYLIAPWAQMTRELQIKEYEKLRDRKSQLADINLTREQGYCGVDPTEFGNAMQEYLGAFITAHAKTPSNNNKSEGFHENENWCVPLPCTDYCVDGFDGAHGDPGDFGSGGGGGGADGDGGDGGGGGCGGCGGCG